MNNIAPEWKTSRSVSGRQHRPSPRVYPGRVTSTLAVAVIGASGRMGSTTCAAVEAAPDLTLVGRYDAGDELGDLGNAEVAVDFTVPDASPGK